MTLERDSLARPAVVCRTEGADCDDLDLKLSKSWLQIAVAGVFAGQGMVFSLALNMTPPPFGSTPYWVLHGGLIFSALVVMAVLGGPLFASTWGMLRERRLSIEGLFTLSLLGAFTGSVVGSFTGKGDVFYEIVSIVIAIYTFGRMLGERSQASLLAESGQLRESFSRAQRILPDGSVESVSIDRIQIGDRLRVDPGAAFSMDGIVRSGVGYVRDTSLTGEPLPVVCREGDQVCAGTYSEDGSFEVEVTVLAGERELDRILQAVETVGGEPSELQLQANRLIQYFLPFVAVVSILTGLVWWVAGSWMDAVFNSMAVLLVACPCALGLATPVAIWQGLYRMARMGLVSRDGSFVDGLAEVRTVYLDKTGTLSENEMMVVETVLADEWQARRADLLAAVRAVEMRSKHPVARSIVSIVREAQSEQPEVSNWRLLPGVGVEASVLIGSESYRLRIGELEGAEERNRAEAIERKLHVPAGKRVYVCLDEFPVAVFVLRERARQGLTTLWQALEKMGIQAVVLTGDSDPGLELPEAIRMEKGLSSADKARIVKMAMGRGEFPCFVGDGINDAAAMSASCSSIAMGSGTGLAQTTAGAQLREDRIEVIPEAIALARRIRKRLRGNLVYAASYNLLGMGLAAAGVLHPVAAAVIMLASSFFVTLRTLRI